MAIPHNKVVPWACSDHLRSYFKYVRTKATISPDWCGTSWLGVHPRLAALDVGSISSTGMQEAADQC